MANPDDILDRALELANSSSWESIRLYEVAKDLGVGLDEIHRYYRQKDDLAEAWFNRADNSMLSESSRPGFHMLDGRIRLQRVIMAWIMALAPYRSATRDMLKYKMEPGHVHLQAAGVLRISRTVQWLLEAAGSKTTRLSRIAEEIGTTAVFVSTVIYWFTDNSEGFAKTEKLLDRMLRKAEKLALITNPAAVVAQIAEKN